MHHLFVSSRSIVLRLGWRCSFVVRRVKKWNGYFPRRKRSAFYKISLSHVCNHVKSFVTGSHVERVVSSFIGEDIDSSNRIVLSFFIFECISGQFYALQVQPRASNVVVFFPMVYSVEAQVEAKQGGCSVGRISVRWRYFIFTGHTIFTVGHEWESDPSSVPLRGSLGTIS